MHKAVIIGCGKIAGFYDQPSSKDVYSHAHAYNLNPKTEVACYVDLNKENAKFLALKYNSINYSTDFTESISNHHPEIVSICTPDNTHYQITESLLKQDFVPKIIFLEKPVCNTPNELQSLLDLSSRRGVLIVPNLSRRFDSIQIQLASMIQSNQFGKLVRGDIFYYSGWKHNGVHVVDTLGYLFNKKIIIKNFIKCSPCPYPGDSTIDFELGISGEEGSFFLFGISEDNYQLFDFDFKFENARLRIEDFGARILYEEKFINSMKENVLQMKNLPLKKSNTSRIRCAIQKMVEFLEGDQSSLSGYQLMDISETMFTIWEGEKWIGRSI